MNPSCPCGLTQEQLIALPNLVGPGGICTAIDARNQPCERRLADHPHAPGKNIFLLQVLCFLSYSQFSFISILFFLDLPFFISSYYPLLLHVVNVVVDK